MHCQVMAVSSHESIREQYQEGQDEHNEKPERTEQSGTSRMNA